MIWAFARLTGLDLAVEWGVIAFALNYIPFIGPLVATLLPTFFAGLQYENWEMAVAVFAGMYAIQFAIGSYLGSEDANHSSMKSMSLANRILQHILSDFPNRW